MKNCQTVATSKERFSWFLAHLCSSYSERSHFLNASWLLLPFVTLLLDLEWVDPLSILFSPLDLRVLWKLESPYNNFIREGYLHQITEILSYTRTIPTKVILKTILNTNSLSRTKTIIQLTIWEIMSHFLNKVRAIKLQSNCKLIMGKDHMGS